MPIKHLTHAQVFKKNIADLIAEVVCDAFRNLNFEATEGEIESVNLLSDQLKKLEDSENQNVQNVVFIECVNFIMRYSEKMK